MYRFMNHPCPSKGGYIFLEMGERLKQTWAEWKVERLNRMHVCTRIHAHRPTDFRYGKRLGKNDCLVTWQRSQRPQWMSKEVYATIPETMTKTQADRNA